jgi:hypothetical protein
MGEVPTGVKVIAVLYYIGAVLTILGGIMMFIGSGFLATIVPFLSGFAIAGGVLMLALGVLGFFIGRGLWNGRNWARIVALIFAVIGLVGAIMGMVGGAIGSNIFGLIINGLIGWYLGLNANVKQAFA